MPRQKTKEIKQELNLSVEVEGRPETLQVVSQQPLLEPTTIVHNLDVGGKQSAVFSPQSSVRSLQSAVLSHETRPKTEDARQKTELTAQDILTKSAEELKAELPQEGARETHNLLKSMKIMTAIMLGKDKNKELARALDTDKSFTSKQIKELEEQGLVKREGEGRETKYVVDQFNLMKFLQTKVVIKWGKKEEKKEVNRLS